MTPYAPGPTFVLGLLPHEIDALRACKRVTKSYPEQIPIEMAPFTAGDVRALNDGKHVVQMSTPEHPLAGSSLQVGDILKVDAPHPPPIPPPLFPGEVESLKAGKTVAKTVDRAPQSLPLDFDRLVTAQVVEYTVKGKDHRYTLEAV